MHLALFAYCLYATIVQVPRGVTKMENKDNELIERAKNFHGKFDPLAVHNKLYYQELQGLCDDIDVCINKFGGSDRDNLKMIFSRLYNFAIHFNNDYAIFNQNSCIHNDVFKACMFTALCSFLYDSKRIKGLSLRKFTYEHSSLQYNKKGSANYFDYERTPKEFFKSKDILSEEVKLRKYRQRFLSERPVYNDSTEWSAIRKTSEHEWSLYFILEDADDDIKDTFKRIKNLYHDIYAALNSPKDDADKYKEVLDAAYKKFCSKLTKIKYENVLKLYKYCLNHICKDTTCYGINLFRFEKELKAYIITLEIKHLLEAKTTEQKNKILQCSILMKDLTFPKLYQYFSSLNNYPRMVFYLITFSQLCYDITITSRLAIDQFIEYGRLGEDWEALLLKTTNEMVEDVLYNPEKIDYSVTSESQEMFILNIDALVSAQIMNTVAQLDSMC